jgi:DNA repair protein RecO (recombination protein O)
LRATLEPAFVLHSKPYRETSLYVHFFTQNYGRVTAIARSARGLRSRFKGCLVPFSRLLIGFNGKADLMQVNTIEPAGTTYFLTGEKLFNGLYLNELLLKLTERIDPYAKLFDCYQTALQQLHDGKLQDQIILRAFEKKLLTELGYGLQLTYEVNGFKVLPDQYYSYQSDRGLESCEQNARSDHIFLGKHLLAIENEDFQSPIILKDAKRLLRLAINPLLGQPLKTRELYLPSPYPLPQAGEGMK